MGRVNVFLRAGNDTGREVSLGGRGSPNRIWAWLNADHRNGESAITVSAEVMGSGLLSKERHRKGGDQRRVCFKVELPEPNDAVTVDLVEHDDGLKRLAKVGAALCLVKGVIEQGADPEHANQCIRFGLEALDELQAEIGTRIPHVILPGGATLARALACVKIVDSLRDGEGYDKKG